ncbi:MAG: NADH-quinone oxidoreductase subunit H [Acetobacteraceae bacterium]
MAVIQALLVQGAQMVLVLLLAPLFTGLVRKVKARVQRRRGPSLIQPYRDLKRLLGKEAVLAEGASWLFRVTPYVIFAVTWVAAALVPTFATGLLFSWSGDLIAIIALLGSARFMQALAAMDIGTSFGGIGASREVMIASLAEPAMLMIVLSVALIAGSTQLSTIADYMAFSAVGLRVSLALGLVAFVVVALAENARIPVDNPATHLELTMVHEAMVLEYSGRHLAMIELAASLKLLLYVSVIGCIFFVRLRQPLRRGAGRVAGEARGGRRAAGRVRDVDRQDARVPRAELPGGGADAGPARRAAAVRLGRHVMMHGFAFDVSHMLAGGLVLASFAMLYQDRLYALINVLALHAFVLAASVAWQASIQHAPHLYITAAIALGFKGIVIPMALRRMVFRLGIHREIETVVGIGLTMLAGIGLVALSLMVMLPVTAQADPVAREDIAMALSVVLIGLLMMVTRRNAVSQVAGFLSLENGVNLAATGAQGMPLVVEISVASPS